MGSWNQWTEYTVEWTEYTVEWTEYTVEWTEYNVERTEYNVERTECNVEWTEYTVEWTEYTVEWTEYTVEYKIQKLDFGFGGRFRTGSRYISFSKLQTCPIALSAPHSNSTRDSVTRDEAAGAWN